MIGVVAAVMVTFSSMVGDQPVKVRTTDAPAVSVIPVCVEVNRVVAVALSFTVTVTSNVAGEVKTLDRRTLMSVGVP